MPDSANAAAGFHLHHGNRLEQLVRTLAGEMRRAPADPLAPDIVLVPHPGMAQWLKMRLADELGIAAHLQFPLPAVWFGQLAAAGVERNDALAWARDALAWRIHGLREPELGPLSAMAALDDRDHLARWQLSSQIAQLFERYQLQRTDWLRAWSAHRRSGLDDDSEAWQARLWRRLIETGSASQRQAVAQRLQPAPPATAVLPQRVFAFGFASLPRHYLDTLHALAGRLPVHLFFVNPCRWYWGDLLSTREQLQRSRRLAYKPAVDADAEGHPLLAAFGTVGRDFFHQLYAGDAVYATETEEFDEAAGNGVLAQIQNGVLELDAGKLDWRAGDRSLRLLSAPNRRRELEALHDILLDLLSDRSLGLQPRDIAVMVPKLSDYAPAIQAVFGGQPRDRHIAWQLTDLAETDRHPLAELFVKLIDLPTWRFGLGEVLDALARPAFAAGVAIDAGEAARLAALLEQAGARWGLDAEFRARMDAGNDSEFTFRFALDRLLFGWLQGDDVDFDGQVAPFGALRGSDAELIGRFIVCLDRLDHWRQRLLAERPLADWASTLAELCTAFFADSAHEDDNAARLRLLSALDTWSERIGVVPAVTVPRRVVRDAIADTLRSTAVSALPGEGVSLCAMVPLRGLPFRVIVLLGLGEGDFPRREREQPDDLCLRYSRPGDRSTTAEDRYLFLEALVSARDVLVLSHVDRDPETGQPRAPSPVLAEFHDHLRDAAFAGDAAGLAARIERVAMLPGDPRHFDAAKHDDQRSGYVPSHASEWLGPRLVLPAVSALAPDPPGDWRDLCALFIDPARTQLRWRGVAMGGHDQPLADEEPFSLDGLGAYRVRDAIVQALAFDPEALPGDIRRRLHAKAQLPPGRVGNAVFDSMWNEGVRLHERHHAAAQSRPLDSLHGSVNIDGIALAADLPNVDAAGVLRLSVGRIDGKRRIAAWLDLLALSLIRGASGLTATLVGRDGTCVIAAPADCAAAAANLLAMWRSARERPVPVYPQASTAFAQGIAGDGDRDKARIKAWNAWQGDTFAGRDGEKTDLACAELARCFARWDDDPFEALALAIYGPAFVDARS